MNWLASWGSRIANGPALLMGAMWADRAEWSIFSRAATDCAWPSSMRPMSLESADGTGVPCYKCA